MSDTGSVKEKRQESAPQTRPTIRDVARMADVSIGTASKALNSSGRLSLETREKVMRVARDLCYRPNKHVDASRASSRRKPVGSLADLVFH